MPKDVERESNCIADQKTRCAALDDLLDPSAVGDDFDEIGARKSMHLNGMSPCEIHKLSDRDTPRNYHMVHT